MLFFKIIIYKILLSILFLIVFVFIWNLVYFFSCIFNIYLKGNFFLSVFKFGERRLFF